MKDMNAKLNKRISVLGSLNVICFLCLTLFSYGLAPLVPNGIPEVEEAAFLDKFGQQLSVIFGNAGHAFMTGQSPLANYWIWLLAYAGPLAISTGIFVTLLALLSRHRQNLSSQLPVILFSWTVVFALANLFAFPVLAPDFWLSFVWGRMVLIGFNPYHTDFILTLAQDLPLGHGMRMTYGPLWAILSTIVAWLGDWHFLLTALLFKLMLAGAWLGSVWIIRLLLVKRSIWHQSVGIIVFGWLPVSVTQIVAEGHNGILMVVFMLLWLYNLERKQEARAALLLSASFIIKYVTAPLFVLDFLHFNFSTTRPLKDYILKILPLAGFVTLLAFGLFFRSFDFFSTTVMMRDWHFFRPSDAITTVEILLNLQLWPLSKIVLLFFPILAIYYVVDYIRKPEAQTFHLAVLAVLSAILFSLVGHVWPWFVLWVLAVAALVTQAALARWIIGIGLCSPFLVLAWNLLPSNSNPTYSIGISGLVMYFLATLWLLFAPGRWFPNFSSTKYKTPMLDLPRVILQTIRRQPQGHFVGD